MSTNQVALTLDKWKLIQFAELDIFNDSDVELRSIGMTPLDIRLFREWQKQNPATRFNIKTPYKTVEMKGKHG